MVCEPFDRRLCACPQPVQSTARNEVHHFFIDLLAKVLRNFPEASSVALNDPVTLAKEFVRIGKKFDIRIQSCAEGKHLASYGGTLAVAWNLLLTDKIHTASQSSWKHLQTGLFN